MKFRPYIHIEKYGETSVKNIDIGECYIFPKIDGSNGCIYMGDDGQIKAGGRKRELTLEQDNKGFYQYVLEQDAIKNYLDTHYGYCHIIYGEWLIQHTIRTYTTDAWEHFYVFDIFNEKTNEYIPYEEYAPMLDKHGIKYIKPITKLTNPTKQDIIDQLDKATFLNGDKAGEGIVIKNYDKKLVAKIVSSEFREQHEKTFYKKKDEPTTPLEQRIAEYFTTTALCEKEYAKIMNSDGKYSEIKLCNIVYYNLIKDDGWQIIKKYKDPIIDYNKLKYYIFEVVKQKTKNI